MIIIQLGRRNGRIFTKDKFSAGVGHGEIAFLHGRPTISIIVNV